MRKKINIRVAEPCNENWAKMTATQRGAFCNACKRDLYDFSKMTDIELVHFFTKNTNKICGRYKESQLNRNITLDTSYNFSRFYKYFLSLFLVFGGFNKVKATIGNEIHFVENTDNEKNIDTINYKGNVKDEEGNNIPFLNVIAYDENYNIVKGTTTDLDGNYTLKLSEAEIERTKFVKLAQIGYDDINIPIKDFKNRNITMLHILIEDIENLILGIYVR